MNQKLKRMKELAGYAVQLVQQEGPVTMVRRGAGFVRRRFFGKRERYLPKAQVLQAQRQNPLADAPVISICVPLYNTPPHFLSQLLDSVLQQTSDRWELCLADASDPAHQPQVKAQVDQAMAIAGQKIRYMQVQNLGISANTNAAASMATGDYLALADHDDILAPHAVYTMQQAIMATGAQFLYSDEALFTHSIKKPLVGHFKPDYAPEYLLCCNYICHLAVFRRQQFEQLGGLRPECDGSQDHDLFLRLLENLPQEQIVHVPQVLYYWRMHGGSTSGGVEAKPYVAKAAQKAIQDHLTRTGQQGQVAPGLYPSTYKVEWAIQGQPLVSILIPNKDHVQDLEQCLQSVYKKNTWQHFEVIVIENNSTNPDTFAYYEKAKQTYPNLQVVQWEGPFNYSAINNFGRSFAKGEYVLLLNNDVEVINPEWLTQMLMQASRPGVAICGAMLYYPDDTVQHAGIITGLGGYAGHSHKYRPAASGGYMFRMGTVQDFSAVTAACLLVRSQVYDAVGGLDEVYTVAFNDVDFCLRVRQAGWRIVWTPYAKLYHYESKSRGSDEKDQAKKARFAQEQARLYQRFGREQLIRDPYYNPCLTLDREDFSESDDLRWLKEARLPDWQPKAFNQPQ